MNRGNDGNIEFSPVNTVEGNIQIIVLILFAYIY